MTHDIVELIVQVPGLVRDGVAGQYADLGYPGLSMPRSYPFARAPSNERDDELSFYIRKVPGGEFTEWLFAEDRTGTELNVSLPHGGFRCHWNPDYKFEYVEVLNMEPEDSDRIGPHGLLPATSREAYVEPRVFDVTGCLGCQCDPPSMIGVAVETPKAEGMSGD